MSATIQPGVVFGLRTLESTEATLQRTVVEAATGKAVATVADDPPAFVIAKSLQSESSAWLTVGTRLAAAEVPTRVASTAVDGTTDMLMTLKQSAIEMQSEGDQAAQASTQIQAKLSRIAGNQQDATVNGVNLVAGAIGGDVTNTQISVPRSPEGQYVTLGAKSLTWMNASVPGLGLATFNGTTDGACLNFSSLAPENISTTSPATQVVIQTYNYGSPPDLDVNPSNPNQSVPYPDTESGQNVGQQWTFEFTDAANPISGSTVAEATDGLGNVIQASHVVPVPLQPGFTVQDAMNALQTAMQSVYFETNFIGSPPTVCVAGNNVGVNLTYPVLHLRPSHPIPVNEYDYVRLNAVTRPVAIPAIPLDFSPYVGTPVQVLPTPIMSVNQYKASNPTVPAVCFNPPIIVPNGTTATATLQPGPPQFYRFTLSPPLPGPSAPGTRFGILIPQPVTPTATTSVWGGAAASIATVNSAMRKANDIAQNLGNSLNALQAGQDHASQSVDALNAGIGNLVDADLGKVAAQMQALQIKQQLAAQSLSLGNQWPKLLVQLFQSSGSG